MQESISRVDALKSKYTDMENALNSGKISQESFDAYVQQLQTATTDTDALKQQTAELQEQIGSTKFDQNDLDKINREISETNVTIKTITKTLKDEVDPEVERTIAQCKKVSDAADKVTKKTKLLSAAAAGVATGIGAMAYKAGQAADDLNTLSKQSGFSTETIQEWQYASDLIDVSSEDIISAARKMKKNMSSTSTDVVAAWQRMGIQVKDTYGNYLDAEIVFDRVLHVLSEIPNETERDVLAMTIFGKSADSLAGIIDDGGAALHELGQQAKDTGLILSQDALDSANRFNDAIDTMKANVSASFFSAGANLAESLTPLLESLAETVAKLAEWFAQLDPRILKLIGTFALLVAGISPVAKTVSSVANAISAVNKVGGIFKKVAGTEVYATFVKWAAIIAIILALITALIAAIAVLTGKGQEMSQTFNSMSGATSNVGGGIRRGSMTGTVPGFASGGVFAPNSPMLAVLGDNRTEREVAAPESTLRSIFSDVLDRQSGQTRQGNGPLYVTMTMDGAVVGQVLLPHLRSEEVRVGPDLLNRK